MKRLGLYKSNIYLKFKNYNNIKPGQIYYKFDKLEF